ncbi:MAG: hypothetical protein J07HB67_02227 [halophilic archaeon J07HB67]|nr:MAG: hypothetical protein J07HB67_02227 [halophilic archaeon J07HB67]
MSAPIRVAWSVSVSCFTAETTPNGIPNASPKNCPNKASSTVTGSVCPTTSRTGVPLAIW